MFRTRDWSLQKVLVHKTSEQLAPVRLSLSAGERPSEHGCLSFGYRVMGRLHLEGKHIPPTTLEFRESKNTSKGITTRRTGFLRGLEVIFEKPFRISYYQRKMLNK